MALLFDADDDDDLPAGKTVFDSLRSVCVRLRDASASVPVAELLPSMISSMSGIWSTDADADAVATCGCCVC